MKKQNIIAALLIGALVGFLGYSVLDNNTDKITNNQETNVAAETVTKVDTQMEENTEALEDKVENNTENIVTMSLGENAESVSSNSIEAELSEEEHKITDANPEDNEYIICVVRKNDLGDSTTYDIVSNTIAKNHYIGLMTLKFDESLVADAEISEDNSVKTEETESVEETETDKLDVKNLELGKYYLVSTNVDIEKGPILTASDIREADEYEVKNFESGRIQNSTFTTDFEQLKLMEPKEALEKSLTLQYTWSFEQIEIFKAYVEGKKAESEEIKKSWEDAEKEIDLDLGY